MINKDASLQEIKLDIYATLVCMVLVLLLGRYVISKVKFLRDYDIPEPVVGGVLVAFFHHVGAPILQFWFAI